jgi:hypothetical protein
MSGRLDIIATPSRTTSSGCCDSFLHGQGTSEASAPTAFRAAAAASHGRLRLWSCRRVSGHWAGGAPS